MDTILYPETSGATTDVVKHSLNAQRDFVKLLLQHALTSCNELTAHTASVSQTCSQTQAEEHHTITSTTASTEEQQKDAKDEPSDSCRIPSTSPSPSTDELQKEAKAAFEGGSYSVALLKWRQAMSSFRLISVLLNNVASHWHI